MSDYPLTSPEEPLKWPQKELGFDNGKTDDAGLEIDPALSFPWPEDPDERIWAPVYMSLNEYTALLSAVDVGASIAWTNDALLVYYILVRNYAGGAMEFCEKVADCILNSDAVKAALAELMAQDGPVQDAIDEISRHGSPIPSTISALPVTEGCDDLDALFAGITSIVDTMHNNNKDFLEVMALAATQTERLAQAISSIPVIGLLPVDEIVGWVGKLQAEVLTNYDAEWTTAVKDEYRCGLFCIARDNDDCSLSYDDIIAFVTDRLGAALDPLNLLESLVQYTILGTWSGTTVVDIMMLNQVNIWKVAGEWLGSVIRTLEAVALLGQDTPDPDWEILCEDCNAEWEHCFDFEVDDGGFTGIIGTYTSGVGWEDAMLFSTNTYRGIALSLTSSASREITNISMTFEYSAGTLDSTGDKTSYISVDTVATIDVTTPSFPTSPQTWSGSETGDDFFVQLLCGIKTGAGDPGGSCVLKTLCISGNGTDPF